MREDTKGTLAWVGILLGVMLFAYGVIILIDYIERPKSTPVSKEDVIRAEIENKLRTEFKVIHDKENDCAEVTIKIPSNKTACPVYRVCHWEYQDSEMASRKTQDGEFQVKPWLEKNEDGMLTFIRNYDFDVSIDLYTCDNWIATHIVNPKMINKKDNE